MRKSVAGKFVYNTLQYTTMYTPNGLRFFRDKSWINEWELKFCLDLYEKKKLTHKQFNKFIDIIHRVTMNHEVPKSYLTSTHIDEGITLPALKYGT